MNNGFLTDRLAIPTNLKATADEQCSAKQDVKSNTVLLVIHWED